MSATSYAQVDRARVQELIERESAALDERTQRSREMYERARALAERRRRLLLPEPRSVADLPGLRRGPAGRRRRRQPLLGLPQRLRLDGPGPRPPGDRRRGARARRRSAPTSRPSPRTRSSSPRSSRARFGLPALALRQLRLGGDDGRDPDRPRADRPRDDREDLRLLPRPPRRRDGVDRRALRRDRRPRPPRLAALRRRHPAAPSSS